jgi:hypothetical protein
MIILPYQVGLVLHPPYRRQQMPPWTTGRLHFLRINIIDPYPQSRNPLNSPFEVLPEPFRLEERKLSPRR